MDHGNYSESLWEGIRLIFTKEEIDSIPVELKLTHQKVLWLYRNFNRLYVTPFNAKDTNLIHYLMMNYIDFSKSDCGHAAYDFDKFDRR